MPETAVASPTPAAATATPATGPEAGSPGTAPAVGGDANRQGAPAEENLGNVDPNTLPPELRSKYENMLRDYKTKTQKLAEERKGLEERLKKADVLEQLEQHPKYPELVKAWNKLTQAEQQQVTDQANGRQQVVQPTKEEWAAAENDPYAQQELQRRDMAFQMQELGKQQQQIQQEILVRDAKEVINAFADAEDDKGEKVRPDFDELHEKGLIQMFLDRMNPQDKRQMSTAIAKAYQQAKEIAEHFTTKGKNAGLGIIQAKAANSTQPPTATAGNTYSGPDPKTLTVKQAMALAREKKVVPRDF